MSKVNHVRKGLDQIRVDLGRVLILDVVQDDRVRARLFDPVFQPLIMPRPETFQAFFRASHEALHRTTP